MLTLRAGVALLAGGPLRGLLLSAILVLLDDGELLGARAGGGLADLLNKQTNKDRLLGFEAPSD